MQACPGRSAGARWPARPRRRRARRPGRGATVGAAGRTRRSPAARPSSRRIAGTSAAAERDARARAASASSTRRVGHRGGVQHRLEGAQPALPVEERAGLLGHRRDRQAPRPPAGSPRCARSSRLTRNGTASSACSARRGSARSAGSTPATTSAPSLPGRGRRDDRVGVAPGRAGDGARLQVPRLGQLGPGGRRR